MLRRNIDINVVAPRISPNISAGRDFFEDIAKIRAISKDMGTDDERGVRRRP